MQSTKQPLIQLKKVRVTYNEGKTNEMTALHEIDLEIYEGEYIVFLGPSGCGKSTLLYTIAGLEIPSAGEVIVSGKNLISISPMEKIEFYRTTIGMIFQAFYLVPHLTAADNIMLAGMFAGRSPADRRAKADMLMDRFGITSYSDRKPDSMSGGQQQRTAIARALINDPHIILADEPVGNLDSKNALTVLDLLADIHSDGGKTVIQVTHNANDARYADRVFYMKDGMVEKVVTNANPDRGGNKKDEKDAAKEADKKSPATELAKLAAMYPNLSETELKSLLIMRTIFMPYTLDTEHLIVKAIERYIKGDISIDELANELDTKHHGAGLYAPKAIHSSRQIEALWNEMEVVKEASPATGGPAGAAALSTADFILKKYRGTLTPESRAFITKQIEERLACRIDRLEFIAMLTKEPEEGGAGLHPRTAARFADEIEVVLTR